ncbi:MAG TPA: formyltetrahydrofolate deformylase [Nitrolancea sp.]|nr:formyltetrahydrofolate deformylase [Nitrolancea sp.]
MSKSAVLLITCPDRKGLVAAIANFLYQYNANILHADQHQDSECNLFQMRVEWDMTGFTLSLDEFERRFQPLAAALQMQWHLASSERDPRTALFVSREDHCLADLLYRHQGGELRCQIPLIISNHTDARRLAEFYDIPFYTIPVAKDRKAEAEEHMLALLQEQRIDFIVLARYMQILSPNFVRQYTNRIINIHHSFLPAFAGAKPYHQAFQRGVKIIGATSHYVTEALDNGPIIEQDVIRVSHRDSVADLVQKGRDLEKVVLSRAVRWHIENRILMYANKTVVFD